MPYTECTILLDISGHQAALKPTANKWGWRCVWKVQTVCPRWFQHLKGICNRIYVWITDKPRLVHGINSLILSVSLIPVFFYWCTSHCTCQTAMFCWFITLNLSFTAYNSPVLQILPITDSIPLSVLPLWTWDFCLDLLSWSVCVF